MTTEEKAKRLVDKFFGYTMNMNLIDSGLERAKQCALIAVDEIIELHKGKFMCEREEQNESYWQEVKQEIEKI